MLETTEYAAELPEEAIVVYARPYLEFDLIVTLLTNTRGKVVCFVKGARHPAKRKQHYWIQPGYVISCQLQLKTRGLCKVEAVTLKETHVALRTHLWCLQSVQSLFELVAYLVQEHDADLYLYQLIVSTVFKMTSLAQQARVESKINVEQILTEVVNFESCFLNHLGFAHRQFYSVDRGLDKLWQVFETHTRLFEEMANKPLLARQMLRSILT